MRNTFTIGVLLFVSLAANAQTSLVGRVYYHPNIMEDEINKVINDASKDISKVRSEGIAKAEKKKGRKLTEAELAEVDKEVEEAQKMMKAMKDGLKTAITITFKDDKNLVMKTDMKLDDAVMKAAGISWAKRKAMKLAMAIMPSEKAAYVQKGNLIIVDDEEGGDTLTLSGDGKYLSGKMDDKKRFKLTRIK